MEEINQADVTPDGPPQEEELSKSFLKLKEHGVYSRTRALRLKEGDVIVAVDGTLFHDSTDNLTDILSEEEV